MTTYVTTSCLIISTFLRLSQGNVCNAPPVTEGAPASITCFFNVDVTQTKRNIKIYRWPMSLGSKEPDSPDTVLDCYWQNVDDFSCQTDSDYKLWPEVSTKAVLRLEKAKIKNEGYYMCKMSPSDATETQSCYFRVHQHEPQTPPTNVPTDQEDKTSTTVNQNSALLVLCVLILVSLGIITFCLTRKPTHRWKFVSCQRSKDDGQVEEDAASSVLLNKGDDSEKGQVSKERIEHYIRILLNVKDSGRLGEYYHASTDEAETSFSVVSSALNPKSLTHLSCPSGSAGAHHGEEGATGEVALFYVGLSQLSTETLNDVRNKLGLDIGDWYTREMVELSRKVDEMNALEKLRKFEKELEDHKRNFPERKELDQKDQKQRINRQKKENDVRVAAKELEAIRKKHRTEIEERKKEDEKRIRRIQVKQKP